MKNVGRDQIIVQATCHSYKYVYPQTVKPVLSEHLGFQINVFASGRCSFSKWASQSIMGPKLGQFVSKIGEYNYGRYNNAKS